MSTLANTVYNVIAPIFIVAGLAVVADRTLQIDARSLSRLIIYLFGPFFVFQGIAQAQLSGDEAGRIVAAASLGSLLMVLTAWGVARLSGFDLQLASAFMLTCVLINAGNYGIAFNRFAFGAPGEERAMIYFVVTSVVSNTFGVYLASRGNHSTRRALFNVLKVPLPYAVLLGLVAHIERVQLPVPLDRATGLFSQATVPAMLVVLGLQLSRASVRGRLQPILMATGMRLVIAPVITQGLVLLLGVSGLTRQVVIIQSAMPTAVMTSVLATEFGADSELVSATILVSTLASVITLSVLLSLIR
ncbi:MAG TPA: AEC family transporter [Aggregatilineaceae bacterium]|nr:AEC family transporter [Aggregatilineaceae bacterium]